MSDQFTPTAHSDLLKDRFEVVLHGIRRDVQGCRDFHGRVSPNHELISLADTGAPAGRHYYEKASTLKRLSDEAIETIANSGSSCTSPYSLVLIQHVHGAASRVGSAETAFALRGESYVICILAAWDGGEADQHSAWARASWKALEPFASGGVYVNFLDNEGGGRVRAAYRGNYQRLVALKNTYDPTNFFALNQNITPAMKEGEPCFTDVETLVPGFA